MTEQNDKVRARIFIEGRVQGVFFRASTRDRARQLGVSGFVANLPDGRVEVVTEGARRAVNELIDWCRSGPQMARVTDVKVEWQENKDEFNDFVVRRF